MPDSINHSAEEDWWRRFDIVSKTLIAAAGFCLSAAISYAEYQNKAREESRRTEEQRRIDRNDAVTHKNMLKEEFRAYYNSARALKPGDQLAGSDLDLATTLAQQLKMEHGEGIYLDSIISLRAYLVPKPNGLAASTNGNILQASETQINTAVAVNVNVWFAVLGSYPISDTGLNQARDNVSRARAKNLRCPQIWQTKISKNYAVVSGGPLPKAEALVAAVAARASGMASDAFVQPNRDWRRIDSDPCAGPK